MFSIKLSHLFYLFVFSYLLLFFDYYIWSAIGITFSIFIFITFLSRLGTVVPIRELIVLIASLQWIVGAKLSYLAGKVHYRYYMYVDEETYMSYVVPATLLFAVSLYVFKIDLKVERIKSLFVLNNKLLSRHSKYLLFIGISATLIASIISIPALSFFLYLLSLFTYVGIIYLFYLHPKNKWLIFFSAMGYFLITSIAAGMFHDLLLIGVFFSFFIVDKKVGLLKKLMLFSLSFFLAFIIQAVKADFREQVWGSNNSVSPTAVFYALVMEELFPTEETIKTNSKSNSEEENSYEENTRLNQGWIISKVMENIPKNKDFMGGSTISEAIVASLIPRFLVPDKKGTSSALENFSLISGLELQEGTSMGLSLVGEFYANYGRTGGMIALFIYGFLLNWIMKLFLINFAGASPIASVLLIVLLYQVVKAETDFIKVVNHLFKSFAIIFLVNFLISNLSTNLFITQDENKE